MRTRTPRTLLIGAAVAALGLAGVAHAQTVDELTVTGRYSIDGDQTLSRIIGYDDLDLTTRDGVKSLKMRIRDTARDLCAELGQGRGESGLAATCESAAFDGAWKQVRVDIAMAEPNTAAMMADDSMAPAATTYSSNVSATAPSVTYTTETISNGPVPDTAANRARFGGPMSNAGQRTHPAGN